LTKVDFQTQHKYFRLNDNIIENLKIIYTCLKISVSPVLVVNNVIIERFDSFIEFACEWFGYKNILFIEDERQLDEYFS
jgi:hypothetical protein